MGFDIFLLLTIKSNCTAFHCCLTYLSIEMLKPLGYMCYYHPNLPASMVCLRCGRRICSSCSKPYGQLALCPTCYHATVMNQAPAPPPAPPVPPAAPTVYAQGAPQGGPQGMPQGGVVYGPYPLKGPVIRRYSLLAVLLLSLSAILIFINADALLWPSFFAPWVSFFPWVALLGPPFNFGFILGIILSLVITGAIFLYMLGFRVLAAFMVFPAAILSFFIGGGFWVGLIVGVLTGIVMIWNGRH